MAEVATVIPMFVPKGPGLFTATCFAPLMLPVLVASEDSSGIHMAKSSLGRTDWQHSPSTFIGGPYIIFAILILLLAYFLAGRKGRIPVWECMMAGWAFAWWGIRENSNADLWLSAT